MTNKGVKLTGSRRVPIDVGEDELVVKGVRQAGDRAGFVGRGLVDFREESLGEEDLPYMRRTAALVLAGRRNLATVMDGNVDVCRTELVPAREHRLHVYNTLSEC